MIKEQLVQLGIIGLVSLVAVFGLKHFSHPDRLANLRCPSDYNNSEEYLKSWEIFVDDYFDKHPGGSLASLFEARKGFYVDKNCAKELESFESGPPESDVDYYTDLIVNTYSELHVAALAAFDSPELMTFYWDHLQKICPFYQPDGASYRNCLAALLEKENTRLGKSPPGILDTYCREGSGENEEVYHT